MPSATLPEASRGMPPAVMLDSALDMPNPAQSVALPGALVATLDTDLTRNTRAPHFRSIHWFLCHMGLY